MMNQSMAGKCFFSDQRAELTIVKANSPEYAFCYVNQGLVYLVKGGEKSIVFGFCSTQPTDARSKC